MDIKEKNKKIFDLAKRFLIENLPEGISENDIKKYYKVDGYTWNDLRDVFIQFVSSAQNYQSMPKVINYHGRESQVREILYGYDYDLVSIMDEDELYWKFRDTFDIKSRDSKQNSWKKWSNSIIDSAKFVSGFKDADDFREFVERFSFNSDTRMALPLLISTKIRGIGFALACDTLKELGYVNYPKPDVHMEDICVACGLSGKMPYEVFEALVRMAEDNKVSPYEVDKTLWLICSGSFYNDKIQGKPLKKKFIEECLELIKS